MKDYLNIGSSPCNEDCAQVGQDNYLEHSRNECKRFIELLRKKFGKEPEGARLAIKSFSHDFGLYREVVCYFDDALPQSVEYCYNIEANTPTHWED